MNEKCHKQQILLLISGLDDVPNKNLTSKCFFCIVKHRFHYLKYIYSTQQGVNVQFYQYYGK